MAMDCVVMGTSMLLCFTYSPLPNIHYPCRDKQEQMHQERCTM